jgi:hypothetical protein
MKISNPKLPLLKDFLNQFLPEQALVTDSNFLSNTSALDVPFF